ncbi:144_t:CDS:2 [Gigaspora margarita]|uniref:144_t:CDS:1 n=1 Tax=Gigaspora margarita TaxID=4874 RepID=A0ABN7V537_GIGMA|nr:144_t:CDS:2 [Gigaspora margarita]
MDQNYEDWDNDNNITPPTSPIIQPVSNADETKNFSRNNVNINFPSLSDLMAEQISLWCNFSSTSQQSNQLQLNKDNDNDILISLNDDDDFSTTTNVNCDY